MFQYKLGFIPTNFVVIGAGGTGGRLVPLLAQFVRTVNWIQNPKIYVVDYDTVEEKNLARQNFIRLDINKPKAIVLAERYSKAFDINIVPVVKEVKQQSVPFSESTHAELGIVKVSLENINNAIIVMCVDNVVARRDIIANIMMAGTGKNILFIDAGNENDFGQIQIFNCVSYASGWHPVDLKGLELPGVGIPFNVDLPFIPLPSNFYDQMVDAPIKSCAELDQTIAINASMATAIMGIIQGLIYQKPLSFHRLNISLLFGNTPEFITLDYIADKLTEATSPRKNFIHRAMPISIDNMLHSIHVKMQAEFKTKPKTKSRKKEKSEDASIAILEEGL